MLLTWVVDFVDRLRQRRFDVRLRVHRAWFLDESFLRESRSSLAGNMIRASHATGQIREAYFLNVQNVSPEREVTVTHVWIASEPSAHALAKPLPAQINPGAQWETWIPVDQIPADTEDVERLGRARLGDDTELKSVPRTDVPPDGYVPG